MYLKLASNLLCSQGWPWTPDHPVFPSQMPGSHMQPCPIQKYREGCLKVFSSFRKMTLIRADRLSLTCVLFLKKTEGGALNPICLHKHLHQLHRGVWNKGLQNPAFELHPRTPTSLSALTHRLVCVKISAGSALEKAVCTPVGCRGQSSINAPATRSPVWAWEEGKTVKLLMVYLLAGVSTL